MHLRATHAHNSARGLELYVVTGMHAATKQRSSSYRAKAGHGKRAVQWQACDEISAAFGNAESDLQQSLPELIYSLSSACGDGEQGSGLEKCVPRQVSNFGA